MTHNLIIKSNNRLLYLTLADKDLIVDLYIDRVIATVYN